VSLVGRGRKVWASGLFLEGVLGDRQAPHNEEAEQALLGSVLANVNTLDAVIGKLEPGDFYIGAHSTIFDRLVKLREEGRAPNPISLRHEFEAHAELEGVGGPAYLSDLASGIVSANAAGEYVKVIRDLSQRRHGRREAFRGRGLRELDAVGDRGGRSAGSLLVARAA